jgi:cbb3-type cytochrome oxidase subunit 3
MTYGVLPWWVWAFIVIRIAVYVWAFVQASKEDK